MTTPLSWLFATINSWGEKKPTKEKFKDAIYIYEVLSVSGVTAQSRGSAKPQKCWDRYGGRGECVSSSGQVSSPAPSLQLSSTSDESLVLLYLSHSDEVELMATFTPADVISVVRLGSREVGEAGTPAGSFSCPPAEVKKIKKKKGLHQPITLFLSLGGKCQTACQRHCGFP